MLIWNAYFIVKILMWQQGSVGFDPLLNLGFWLLAVSLFWLRQRREGVGFALQWLLLPPLVISLTLNDLNLLFSTALVQQVQALSSFSREYILELILRIVTPERFWLLVALTATLHVLNRYMRTFVWVGTAVLVSAVVSFGDIREAAREETVQETSPEPRLAGRQEEFTAEKVALGEQDYDRFLKILEQRRTAQNDLQGDTPTGYLNRFFADQSKLRLEEMTPLVPPDFDILALHVCSISWADLKATQQTGHPVIADADLLFSNFNTASSYSGPSVIRFLRSGCGQMRHATLYDPLDLECAFFHMLKDQGYQIQLGLNHDGRFDRFKEQIIENLGSSALEPQSYADAEVGTIAFDGSLTAKDGDFLRRWWAKRLVSGPSTPVALYYNTITLHDGNKIPGLERNSLKSYEARMSALLNDIQDFINHLKKSERNVLVLIVPEHGAGMTGEYGQLVGMRELPTPAVTQAPVVMHWISPEYKRRDIYKYPITVSRPTSYFGVNTFLERWMALPPDQRNNPDWSVLTTDLPATPLVSEQQEIVVIEKDDQTLIRIPGEGWKPLVKNKEPAS